MKSGFHFAVLASAAALFVTGNIHAQDSRIEYLEDGIYSIRSSRTIMTIDSRHGARILSYRYGDTEILSQSKAPNSFGSTFWTSPQKEWNWPPIPEYDSMEYEVSISGDTLRLSSQIPARMPYKIVKSFCADSATGSVSIEYTIVNTAADSRKVAPWEITRVPGEGMIFFDAPLEEISPANLLNFTSANGLSWYTADVAGANRKINANGKGWLAYANGGLLLVKQFEDLNPSQPAPDEAEIQVYVNAGKTYIEIESQGAYTTLGPGESLSWTVRWHLVPYSGEEKPSEELKALAASLARQ